VRSSRASDDLAVDSYGGAAGAAAARPSFASRLWNRQLSHYPDNGPRTVYLGITVLATIILYYELYIQGAVATQIIADFHMTFTYFVMISVVGNAVGAFASLAAGLADRWGRANLVTYGLLITGALLAFGLPHSPNKQTYLVLFAIVSAVEGVVLVATPALIRDFSPQLGRATAMAFWTMGPVIGSLVVTEVSSHTLNSHPNWRFQFYVCGIVGLIVFLVALFGLRELSPRLRDQLMVSLRDRALIEARAKGIDVEQALHGQWGQMIRPDIVGSAFAIAVFLLAYYILVGFIVVYFATVFGYSESKANGLANWYWIANILALLVAGFGSDKIRVRKPLMVVGGIVSAIGVGIWATLATKPHTSYYTFAGVMVVIAVGSGVAYCAWMASFTETVEKHNPAATATGLAVWGWIIRIVVTVSLIIFTFVVPATSTLVDQGSRAQAIQAKYPKEVATLQSLEPATSAALTKNPTDPVALPQALQQVCIGNGDPAAKCASVRAAATRSINQLATASAIDPTTLNALSAGSTSPVLIAKATGEISKAFNISNAAALTKLLALAVPSTKADLTLVTPYANQLVAATKNIPADDLAFLQANAAKIAKAQKDNPGQWQHWWWVCFAGQLVFLPFIFVMTGRWSPRKARQDELEHERYVEAEMAKLSGQHIVVPEEGGAPA
jgi:MFS family permease